MAGGIDLKLTFAFVLAFGLLALGTATGQFGTGTRRALADNPYCNTASGVYDANACIQTGGTNGTGATGSAYCAAGTASYNATLCPQYSGTSSTSIYCPVGGIGYNPPPCAQYGGARSASLYRTPRTARY